MLRLSMTIALAISTIGCAPPCEDVPLSGLSSTPRFVVQADRTTATVTTDGGFVLPIDGGLPDAGPPGTTEAYAALPLYASDGTLVHDDWIDTRTRWAGARDTFDSHDLLPWTQPHAQLALLLQDVPSIAGFAITSGDVAYDLVPSLGGAIMRDFAAIDEALGLATLSDGRVLVLDLASQSIQSQIDLRAYAGPDARAYRIAPLADGTMRVVVGIAGEAGPDGAVAIVDARTMAVSIVPLRGLRACAEVSALAGGSIAALCAGTDPDLDAGIALLEASEATLASSAVRLSTSISTVHPPTNALVGMSEGWVAVLSRGDANTVPDALLAVHLASGATQTLATEAWSPRWGAALGEGAFAADIGAHGELWWPSVASGILRFRIDGTGADARFVLQPSAALPGCLAMPARRVRALPP